MEKLLWVIIRFEFLTNHFITFFKIKFFSRVTKKLSQRQNLFYTNRNMTTETLKNRSEIKQEDKWNVEAIFKTNEAWKEEFSKFSDLKSNLEPVMKFKGKIESCSSSDIKSLLEAYFHFFFFLNVTL